MKPNRKSVSKRSDEAMMWVVVLTSCFVMIWTAVGFVQ